MAQYVRHNEWFIVTQIGFEFYTETFSCPYPFGVNGSRKYDQIVVPDFNAGAMENVGAVTFSESKISRSSLVTPSMKLSTAETILHELAHMWF